MPHASNKEQVLVDQLRNELRGTGERVTDHHERYCEVLVALEPEFASPRCASNTTLNVVSSSMAS